MRRNMAKNQSGITMMSLVITVILLLLLATVTIAVLTGENGVIKRADDAHYAQEVADVREDLMQKWYIVVDENKKDYLNNTEMASRLQDKLRTSENGDSNATAAYREENDTIEVTYKGHDYEIQTNRQITNKREVAKRQIQKSWESTKNKSQYPTTNDKIAKLAEDLGIDPEQITTGENDEIIIEDNDGYEETIIIGNNDNIDIEISPVSKDKANIVISKNPENVEIFEGEEATFDFEATTKGSPSYQWYSIGKNATVGGDRIKEATGESYKISNASNNDDKYYYCEISASLDGKTTKKKTEAAKLTVVKKITNVTLSESEFKVDQNSNITISTSTDQTGGEISYQWFKNSTDSTSGGQAIDGETQSTLETTVTESETTYYYVEVTQTAGGKSYTITSGTAKVEVNVKVPLEIKTQPQDTQVIEGQTTQLTVENTGNGNITYQWYKNDTDSTSGGEAIEGEKQKTLTISEANKQKEGYYYVEITQDFNGEKSTVTSDVVQLTVNEVTITADPASVSLLVGGENANVTLGGNYIGTLSIQTEPQEGVATAAINGNTLTITSVGEGTTSVVVKESNANKTVTVDITVQKANYSIDDTAVTLTLEEAISKCKNNNELSTIKLLENITDSSPATIDGKNIKFDNNGKTLTRTQTITINSGATLEITGNGTIQTESPINLIVNNGTLNITHTGTIENKNTSNNSRYAIYCNSSTSNTNISGNTTIIAHCRTLRVVGTFNMSAGTLKVSGTGVSEGFTVGLNGSSIETNATFSGGKIENTNNCAAVYYTAGSTVTFKENIEVTSSHDEYSASAKCVQIGENSTANIEGGTFRCINGLTAITAANAGSTLNITGGEIYGTKNAIRNANATSTTNIYGGTIKGDEAGVVNSSTGTINIGDSTKEVNNNNPSIEGGTYGISLENASGKWNFFNGILKGTVAGFNTQPTQWREHYKVTTGTEPIGNVTYNTAYLDNKYTITFNPNGGEVSTTTKTVTYNTAYGELPTPTRTGYAFKGWTETQYEPGAANNPQFITSESTFAQDSDKTLYAYWADETAPSKPTIVAKLVDANGTTYTPGTWTNQHVYVELSATDDGSGIKEFQWYENGAWTTRELTTTSNTASITYTAARDTTLRFRAVDNGNNASEEATIEVKMDMTKPIITASNITYGQDLEITIVDAASGVTGWQVTNSSTAPTSGWTDITATASANVSSTGLNAGTWYVWAKDGAGNVQYKQITVSAKNITDSDVEVTLGPTSNIDNWKINNDTYASRFNVTYDSSTQMSNIAYRGAGGWEVKYLPIATTPGQSYTFSCDYINTTGYAATIEIERDGIGMQALRTPPTNNSNDANSVQTTYLPKAKNTNINTYQLTFTAETPITYIAFNFGMASDSANIQLSIGNFRLTNNWAYIYDGEAKEITTCVKNTTSNNIYSNGTDYTLTYPSDVTNIGTKTVTIMGTGNCSGTKTVDFNIAAKPVTAVTYEYGINERYDLESASNTGYQVNWDKDFTIETVVNVSTLGKRYLIMGGYNGTSKKDFNIEFNASNQLRLWLGTNGHEKKAGTIAANEDITVKFVWNVATQTYELTAKGTTTDITISNQVTSGTNYEVSGMATNGLRIGCLDYRVNGAGAGFQPITVKSFKVTSSQEYNEAIYLPTAEKLGYTIDGWYTEASAGTKLTTSSKVPASATTYYAHWNAKTFTVTYNANGGTVSPATTTVTYNAAYGNLATPTRTGLTFKGWNGKNLFNKDATPERSGYIQGDGSAVSNSEYSTYKINIEPNTTYTITNSGKSTAPGYVVYDAAGNRLAGANYANTAVITFTTPANAAYIEASVVTQNPSPHNRYDKDTFQLEKGAWATTYEPYYIQPTTIVTQPKDHTINAIWQDETSPVISTATASTTLDTANYVDFTATDDGAGIAGYNITTSTTAPTTWIPVVDNVEQHTETKYELDAAWARVFHHNTHWGKLLYSNATEAQSVDTVDKYSVLGNIANYINNSNKYEFLLQYPQVSATQYNRWLQTDNPITTTIANVSGGQKVGGYEAIHIDWTGNYWGGLALSTSASTYINGSTGHGNWFYAIGAYTKWNNSIPGPSTAESVVNLWSRIDEKTTSTTNSLTRRVGDIKNNGTYYIWVKDSSGNTAYKEVSVSNVDTTAPTATITSTNNVAASQTVSLNLADDKGVVAYYWGTANPSTANTNWTDITSATSKKIDVNVDDGGTYYLAVMDAAGNRTVTNKKIYKTTLVPVRGTVSQTEIITTDGNTINLPNATATGATFTGWYTDITAGTKQNTSYTPTANATFYGHWTLDSYQLTVNPNGGLWNGSISTQTFNQNYGTDKTIPNPSRTGYTFNGWTLSGSGWMGQSLHTDGNFSTGNNGVVAYNNTANDNTVTITRQAKSTDNWVGDNELKVVTSKTAKPGMGGFVQTTNSAASQRYVHVFIAKLPVGYNFQWNMNATGTGRTVEWLTSRAGTGGFEVYAYQLNAGSSGTFKTFGHVYVEESDLEAPTFYVAYSDIINITNTKGTKYVFGAENTTLTANWTASTYTVTYNANGGSGAPANNTVTYNGTYGTLPTPTKEGYTFKGWSYLPEGYQQLEYIEGTGTQYLDTGYKPGPNTGIKADYQFTSTSPTQQRLYGARGANTDAESITYEWYINGSTGFSYAFKDGSGNWKAIGKNADTTRHKIEFNVTDGYYKYDSGAETEIAEATTTNTSKVNMFLMATTSNGTSTVDVDYNGKVKLYSFSIYENGNIVRHYVPCKKTDGTIGMYEIITGTFCGNIGTGTFTAGPESYITSTTPVSIETNHTIYTNWADETAPAAPTITAKLNNSSGAAYTAGTWTNANLYIELTSSDSGSGIKEFQWYENGAWTTRALNTSSNKGTITYTASRDTTIRYRVVDNAGNASAENTIAVKMDKDKPTITASNITYGESLSITLKDTGSGVNGWQVTNSSTAPTSGWATFTATASKTVSKSDLTAGTWYVWTEDAAGNTQSKQIVVNKADMTLTTGNYTGAYDGNSHSITLNVTVPSSGAKVYYSTTTELTSSNYTNTSVASTTKPTQTNAGTTTVYWYVESNNANYNDKWGSNTITISASTTLMSYTNDDYSGVYDGNSHSITLNVTTPTGCTLYYSTSTSLTSSNYTSKGTTTKPTQTNVGTTTVYWYIKSGSANYADKSGSNTITITKQTVTAPTNVAVSTAGIVTWTASGNATGYEISINNSTWTAAESGVNYLDTIIGATGSRTVYVRAVNSNTTNYTTPSSNASKAVTVRAVTFAVNNTAMGAVDTATYNVINGATVSASSNKLTIKGVTTGTTTANLKTITATAKNNYQFSSWSKTSGSITAATTITATFVPKVYTITLNNQNATSAGTTTIYEKYNTGYYTDSGCATQMSTSANGITVPTKTGYTFKGYYTAASGGTQYIGTNGRITSSASATNFTANGNLFAQWTPNTNTAYVVNHYKHDYGTNTYTLESSENKTGTTDATLTLANLKKTITGFTYMNGFVNNSTPTTRPSSGAVTETTILPDGSLVLNLYYRPNYLYVQYDMNGGSLGSGAGADYTESGSLVAYKGNVKMLRGFYGSTVGGVSTTTFATAATSGLHDYNGTSINIVKTGYTGQVGAQWNTKADGTGTSYSQSATSYQATAMATACGYDLSSGDVTVTLYVNWVMPNYGAYSGSTLKAYYGTLADATSKATSGYTIKPLASISDASTPTIASGRTLTIDLNSYTVTMTKTISNAGTLTITGTGELTASGVNTITNTGTFTKSGTSTISNTATATYYVLNNTGTATLSAGNVTGAFRAVNNGAAGKLNVNGATVSSTASNIAIYSTGTATGTSTPAINISSGTVSSAGNYAIQNAAAGHVYITGGTVTTTGATAIYGSSSGPVTIGASGSTSTTSPAITGRIFNDKSSSSLTTVNGGKVTGTTSQAICSLGNITINGGAISATKSYAVYCNVATSGVTTITGGTITSANNYTVTTPNASGGTINISGGTITRTSGTTGAVNNEKGATTITGGTIKSNAGVGVYATTGTVTLGTNDSTISTTIPSITGATWGVRVTQDTGKFYFYDGTVTGKTNQSITEPTATATGCVVRKTATTSTTETATLGMTLKANTSASSTGAFLGTSITRDKIKKVSFATSISGHSVNNTTCWDVSSVANAGQVLMWVASGDATNGYEIVIGQNGGVIGNPESQYLFSYIGYSSITAQIELANFDTSKVTDMSWMFNGCSNISTLDVRGFDTSKVTNMKRMFGLCENISTLDVSGFDTSKVTDMGWMFNGCSSISTLDVSGFDTSKVTSMALMFYNCQEINTLNVSGFDTSNVTSMRWMFCNCEEINTLDVSGFDTSKVTDMTSMFQGCSNISTLDVNGFDTSTVTDMSYMFDGCIGLTRIDVSGFDTSKVTNMSYMFSACYNNNINTIDVSRFNTSKVTNMSGMFYQCQNVRVLDVSGFNTSNVTNMGHMFYKCNELTTIYASNSFVTTAVTNGNEMFTYSTNLVGGAGTVYSSSNVTHAYAHIDGGTSNPGYFTDASTRPTITAGGTNIKTATDISTLYGQTTTYKSTSHPSINWQLFYADSSNYYLIASDYVPNAELPCNGNTVNGVTYTATDLVKSTNTTNQFATYCARFASSSSYNDGVLTAGTIYKNGSASTAFTATAGSQYLTTNYLKWVAANLSSTNTNICSVAYMMDTNKWSSFADGVSGAYAIGGPTIEMLSLSWNAVSGHTQMTDYTTLSSSNSNTNGYIAQSPETGSNFFGTSTNMWFIKEQTKAYGYWLASPSSVSAAIVGYVTFGGVVANGGAHLGFLGFRPVVSIPRSAIK